MPFPCLITSRRLTILTYGNVCWRHFTNIGLPGESLGTTTLTEHSINIKPNATPAYRLHHSQRESVDDQSKDILEEGVIQHAGSPWNNPLFLVHKKDGTFRPVIDIRGISLFFFLILVRGSILSGGPGPGSLGQDYF